MTLICATPHTVGSLRRNIFASLVFLPRAGKSSPRYYRISSGESAALELAQEGFQAGNLPSVAP
jgi:hypothetical protein